MRLYVFLSTILSIATASRTVKRQALFDELINGALKLVQPIFDTGQTLQDGSPVIPKKSSNAMRETRILGSPDNSGLENVPICKGDSQICKFISCAAHNFKQDESFANLNLAAQVLGDQKLRKAISSNPEAITSVCREQGLTHSQCKLFAQGFRIIDNFMTTIERPPTEPSDRFIHPEADDPTELAKPSTYPNEPPRSRSMGSRTWSTHEYSLYDEIKPRPVVPIVTHHTAEKRAPFDMELGGIAKKLDTPHAQKPPPKTIFTSKYKKISDDAAPIVPRPKRYVGQPRIQRSPDYYDELREDQATQDILGPMNDSIDKNDTSNRNANSPVKSSRQNCIQYVVDL